MAWLRKTKYSDVDILADLRQGGTAHTKALEHLFFVFRPDVIKLVRKMGGTEEEAQEVLHEGLLRLEHSILQGNFRGDSTIKTYFNSICRNYYQKIKSRSSRIVFQETSDETIIDDGKDGLDQLEEDDFQVIVQEILQQMKPRCIELLILTDGIGEPMELVANQLGISNTQIARNEKTRCRKKLRNLILSSSSYQRMIDELLNLESSTEKKQHGNK
ncbi:MAG: sigma-70 family RNA polymerase sigma factor [Bacteroidota bacterium]